MAFAALSLHPLDYRGNLICMRYDRGHKERTHKWIVKNAARRFRSEGLSEPGVAALMKASGLTVGGFYKHFKNKDDLLAEALRVRVRVGPAPVLGALELALREVSATK